MTTTHDAYAQAFSREQDKLRTFAEKVGAFLSFHYGESYEGKDKELDELFELCEKYAPTRAR